MSVEDTKCTEANLDYNNLIGVYSDEFEPWWGYVVEHSQTGGQMAITCHHILHRLGRRLTRPGKMENVTAGAIFRFLLGEANREESCGINLGEVFDGGKVYTMEFEYESIYDKIQDLLEMSGCYLQMETIRPGLWELSLVEKVGRDLTDTVVFYRGIDFDGKPEMRGDNTQFANRVFALGQHEESSDETERPIGEYTDWNSVQDEGLSELPIEVSDVSDRHTLDVLARAEVNKRLKAYYTIPITLNRKRELWSKFTDGDIVCVYLPGYMFKGAVLPMRILGREPNEAKGIMVVAAEVVRGEQAQLLSMYKNSHYGTRLGDLPELPKDENPPTE